MGSKRILLINTLALAVSHCVTFVVGSSQNMGRELSPSLFWSHELTFGFPWAQDNNTASHIYSWAPGCSGPSQVQAEVQENEQAPLSPICLEPTAGAFAGRKESGQRLYFEPCSQKLHFPALSGIFSEDNIGLLWI